MFRRSLIGLAILANCITTGITQAQSRSGSSFYLGVGGGLDILQTARFGTVAFKGYHSSGWGLEAGFRRTAVQSRNKPGDYSILAGGGSFRIEGETLDDANLWNLAISRRCQLSKSPRVHGLLSAGLSLTDYFENQFTYVGIQPGTRFLPGNAANYTIAIDRQASPGFYGRAAADLVIGRGFAIETGVWTSLVPKLQMVGMELLLNFGKIPKPKPVTP